VTERTYRAPTELELAFLRVVARGYPKLEQQVESCQIADYDRDGWCYVRVVPGQSPGMHFHLDGPTLQAEEPVKLFVDTILWTNEDGLLTTVEVVDYRNALDEPYPAFVEAAAAVPPRLAYES
jgi:hypothetical protein